MNGNTNERDAGLSELDCQRRAVRGLETARRDLVGPSDTLARTVASILDDPTTPPAIAAALRPAFEAAGKALATERQADDEHRSAFRPYPTVGA